MSSCLRVTCACDPQFREGRVGPNQEGGVLAGASNSTLDCEKVDANNAISLWSIALGGEDVKPECVLVAMVTILAMVSVSPALAAPRQIEDFCFETLQQATLAYREARGSVHG